MTYNAVSSLTILQQISEYFIIVYWEKLFAKTGQLEVKTKVFHILIRKTYLIIYWTINCLEYFLLLFLYNISGIAYISTLIFYHICHEKTSSGSASWIRGQTISVYLHELFLNKMTRLNHTIKQKAGKYKKQRPGSLYSSVSVRGTIWKTGSRNTICPPKPYVGYHAERKGKQSILYSGWNLTPLGGNGILLN